VIVSAFALIVRRLCSVGTLAMSVFGVIQNGMPRDTLLVMGKRLGWDGKVYRRAKAGEGYRSDTADAALRSQQNARRRKKYAQMRAEEERDGCAERPLMTRISVWK
jgi:hypothetical protein